jgi:two-component system cell cycle sensor histidine kinase/response regulator CckA
VQLFSWWGKDMSERRGTVLVVDDEEMALYVEVLMLQRIGYNTLEASNSAEACQLYRNEKDHIDLVVLDMILPDENGAATYKVLKRINPDIKVLVSTGYGTDDNVRQILNDRQNGLIQKPFKFKRHCLRSRSILSVN